jgi:hypothetical protein
MLSTLKYSSKIDRIKKITENIKKGNLELYNELIKSKTLNREIKKVFDYINDTYPDIEEKIECEKKITKKRYGDCIYNTQIFITSSIIIYGYIFDYTETVYIDNSKGIKLHCKKFGHEMSKRYHNHFKKSGNCELCWYYYEFVRKSKLIHIDENGKCLYIYDMVKYNGCKDQVMIFCIKCDEYFWQTPENHMNKKHGCNSCAIKRRTTTQDDFIKYCEETHIDLNGNILNDYSRVIYVSANKPVEVVCLFCKNSFYPTPYNHISNKS